MRTLILSSNTGGGHNSCANAIKEVYDANGEECVIADGLSFISDRISRFMSWGHIFVYRHIPRLFGWGYKGSEKHTAFFRNGSCVYALFTRGTGRLKNYILSNNFDSVICTHSFTALMLSEVQKRCALPIKTAFVATDYTCSPGVNGDALDCYFIPDERLAPDFERAGVPKEKMIASGIPVRQMFYRNTDKASAKERMGIPANHKHIVMTCGSMGCGHMKKQVCLLHRQTDETCDISVICGTNKGLKRRLERKYAAHKRIHVHGYIEDMSLLLDSADIFLTKPGGISTTEAAVKKVPMLLADAVGGCEEYNSSWFVRSGTAVAEDKTDALTAACIDLLSNEKKQAYMKNCFENQAADNAAATIYTLMKDY